MDIGELIVYILIGIGLLSQVFGGKKKRPPSTPPQRRPPPPTTRPGETGVAKQKAASYMERILKELELDDLLEQTTSTSEPPVTIRPPLPPRREPLESPGEIAATLEEVRRPLPLPEGQSLESLEPSGVAEHERFHELYVKPLGPREVESARSRGHKLINSNSLRDAILLKEIIGPPKALE